MLNPIKNTIPNQLRIFNFTEGRNSEGVCLLEINMKLMIAKNGAVKKASMVAIFTKIPISDIKNNKMQTWQELSPKYPPPKKQFWNKADVW